MKEQKKSTSLKTTLIVVAFATGIGLLCSPGYINHLPVKYLPLAQALLGWVMLAGTVLLLPFIIATVKGFYGSEVNPFLLLEVGFSMLFTILVGMFLFPIIGLYFPLLPLSLTKNWLSYLVCAGATTIVFMIGRFLIIFLGKHFSNKGNSFC